MTFSRSAALSVQTMAVSHVAGAARIARPFTLALVLLALPARGAIPESARNDPRFDLGYLVVTHYPGVRSDGSGDSTAGLQQAIKDASSERLALFFPPGTYVISDTLRAYKYQLWNSARGEPDNPGVHGGGHVFIGSGAGTRRPLIKLAASAARFSNPAQPRPMLIVRNFKAENAQATTPAEPTNPMEAPANFSIGTANLMGEQLRGIDFDLGRNAGAIGLVFAAAQGSQLEDVRIDATGGYAGIVGTPGRNSGAANIEVQGGRHGVVLDGSLAGAVLVGLQLTNQTNAAVVLSDFVPSTLIGFNIVKSAGPAILVHGGNKTAPGTGVFVDGTITLGSGVAMDNTAGRNVYIENVYVRGATTLIQSGNQAPIHATASWNRIENYVYNDQAPVLGQYPQGSDVFPSYALLDNAAPSRTPVPWKQIVASSSAPPSDLVSRHLWRRLPYFAADDSMTKVITAPPYNAVPDDGRDDHASIQRAVDEASAAGHGRVFIPMGTFEVSRPVVLRRNTVLFGIAFNFSRIRTHESWRPTTGMAWLFETDDAPDGTTFLGFLRSDVRSDGLPGCTRPCTYDRFGHVRWRSGRGSMTIGLDFNRDFAPADSLVHPRHLVEVVGSGGGRHFFLKGESYIGNANPAFRSLLVSGTTSPLTIYGLNAELLDTPSPETAAEIIGARNVRVFNTKREGGVPTIVIRNSRNVGVFGSGAMRNAAAAGSGGFLQVVGDSDDVLITTVNVQTVKNASGGRPIFREALTNRPERQVLWPEGLSVYKRGNFEPDVFIVANTCGDGTCTAGEGCLCSADCGVCPADPAPPGDDESAADGGVSDDSQGLGSEDPGSEDPGSENPESEDPESEGRGGGAACSTSARHGSNAVQGLLGALLFGLWTRRTSARRRR